VLKRIESVVKTFCKFDRFGIFVFSLKLYVDFQIKCYFCVKVSKEV